MPRKTPLPVIDPGVADPASMRPRPDAAENAGAPHRDVPPDTASMRPRPDAAENVNPTVGDSLATPLQ